MLVDSHCHLDMLKLDEVEGGLQAVLDAAEAMDVRHMLCVSVDLQAYPSMRDLVAPFEQVSISVGVHPVHEMGVMPDRDGLAQQLVDLARQDGAVAIGETGLDYFHAKDEGAGSLDWQHQRFRAHIDAAKACGRPLIVHTRSAREDTLRILREEGAQDCGGVMHCFAEDWATAKAAMDLGFFVSFSGIVTFKNALELKQVAKQVPDDRFLVETDSPYLAPVPKRGKPNQPGFTRHTAEYLAQLRGIEYEQVAALTTANYQALFGPLPVAA